MIRQLKNRMDQILYAYDKKVKGKYAGFQQQLIDRMPILDLLDEAYELGTKDMDKELDYEWLDKKPEILKSIETLREIHDERLHETTSLSIELEAAKTEIARLRKDYNELLIKSMCPEGTMLTKDGVKNIIPTPPTPPTNKAKLPEKLEFNDHFVPDNPTTNALWNLTHYFNKLRDYLAEREGNHA